MAGSNEQQPPPEPSPVGPLSRRRRVGSRFLTEEELQAHLARQRRNRERRRNAVPPPVAGTLAKTLKSMKLDGPLRRRRLHQAWAAALRHDPRELARTRIVALGRGILTIEVDSPATASEYKRFFKPHILASLAESLNGRPYIVDLVVRVGSFRAVAADDSAANGIDVP